MTDQTRNPMHDGRYAVRVTGPAGHSRYITRRGDESDDQSKAQTFQVAVLAHRLRDGLQPIFASAGAVYDVVNLDDAEDACHE